MRIKTQYRRGIESIGGTSATNSFIYYGGWKKW
jgi:hypothetical protein